MRTYEIIPSLIKTLKKLSKKDKSLYKQVMKKIDEVIKTRDVEHYKNLRHNMKNLKRVHIGAFVLVFECRKKQDKITFKDFDHHDKIYTQ